MPLSAEQIQYVQDQVDAAGDAFSHPFSFVSVQTFGTEHLNDTRLGAFITDQAGEIAVDNVLAVKGWLNNQEAFERTVEKLVAALLKRATGKWL